MFLEDYDVYSMFKDLQKICKVQDWDITLDIISGMIMANEYGNQNYSGLCYKNRLTKEATVNLNRDIFETEDDVYCLQTIVHELIHVTTDDLHYAASSLLDYIEDETTKSKEDDALDMHYERLNNEVAKIIVSVLGQEYLNKFKVEVKDEESKNSKRCMGKKEQLC